MYVLNFNVMTTLHFIFLQTNHTKAFSRRGNPQCQQNIDQHHFSIRNKILPTQSFVLHILD